MPLNLPTVTRSDISFGPARLFLGPAGATPTVDVGAITEDGVSIEIATEQRQIMQGNPKLVELTFNQSQSVMLKVTSIEWDFNSLTYALGAGTTATVGGTSTWTFGGQPCVTEVALHVQHQMCASGNTLNVYVWRAVGDGNTSLPFTHDEHQFEYTWNAMRAETDWAGVTLPTAAQLIKVERVT